MHYDRYIWHQSGYMVCKMQTGVLVSGFCCRNGFFFELPVRFFSWSDYSVRIIDPFFCSVKIDVKGNFWERRIVFSLANVQIYAKSESEVSHIYKISVSYLQIFIVSSGLLRLRTPTLPLSSRNLIENPTEGTLAQLPCIWFNSRIEQFSGSKFLHQGIVWSGTLGGFLLSG